MLVKLVLTLSPPGTRLVPTRMFSAAPTNGITYKTTYAPLDGDPSVLHVSLDSEPFFVVGGHRRVQQAAFLASTHGWANVSRELS